MIRSRVSMMAQHIPFMEPIHVLGAGSIGLLFASSMRIAFPSYPLTMILRDNHAPRLEKEGQRQYMNVCIFQNKRPRIVRLRGKLRGQLMTEGKTQTTIKNLLLTTKASDACAALKSVLTQIEPNARVIVLCNGAMAVQQELSELLASHSCRVILATTTHGAYRSLLGDANEDHDDDEIYHVTHAGIGTTFIEGEERIAQLWDQSGLVATSLSKPEMDLLLWKKLAANCVINPLTSILDCTNGDLVRNNYFQNMFPALLTEISMVAQQSISTSFSGELAPDKLLTFVDTVIADTKNNTSSMRQDIMRRKPTEIKYLNGFVVRKGEQLGIKTPKNQELIEKVRELEAST